MNRTVLQVPMSPALRKEAEEQALQQGFSSLQEAVRIFLKKLARRETEVVFTEKFPSVQLSKRAMRRYDKQHEDFIKGKNIYSAKDIDDLMRQLNE